MTPLIAEETIGDFLNISIFGLVILFSALVLFIITIIFLWKIISSINKPDKTEANMNNDTTPVVASPIVLAGTEDDDEVIAVISAAVAMIYEGTGVNYAVRSVRPVRRISGRPVWASAGITDNTRAF